MALPLYSDFILNARAATLQTILNSGHTLHLFSNNFPPTPATPLSSFIECTFGGYVPLSLAGLFTGPTQVQPGQWQLDSGLLSFPCSMSPGQTIYGWWIDDGTNLVACQLIDAPFAIAPGLTYFLLLRPQEISQSILS